MKSVQLFLPLLFCLLTLFACRDACEEVVCQNGGICVEGECDCPEGFTGPNCGIVLDPCLQLNCVNADTCRQNAAGKAVCVCEEGFEGERCERPYNQKYLGMWRVSENCEVRENYELEIEPGLRFNEITIANFNNQANSQIPALVIARPVSPNTLFIPEQFMPFGVVTGQGNFNGNAGTVQLSYQIVDGSDTLRCTATLTRN